MKSFTADQYKEMNAKGFEGDENIYIELKKLASEYNIKTIFETGSQLGNTTKRLSQIAATVSCELSKEVFDKALVNIGNHALLFNCESPKLLRSNIHNIDDRTLLYLDAHGNNGTPLIEELEIIAESGAKPVIVIHDFKVPGKDFGFDSYRINGKMQDYTFEWIQPSLEKIYGNDYSYHYNDKAEGAYRGVIYIYPSNKPEKKKEQNVESQSVTKPKRVMTEEHKQKIKEAKARLKALKS